MKRLKQGLLCLLSCAATAHADSVKPLLPEMVTVQSGWFMMGSPPDEPERSQNENPRHLVTITKPFEVGKYEVTFAEWDSCVADGGCDGYRPDDNGWGRGKRPVIHVGWEDAHAYIDWLNKKTGKQYRLLSEAEWEYAARGWTSTTYYWGNDIGKNNENCNGCSDQFGGKQTAPVGSFKPNPFGLYDMLGNVREWTEDTYHRSYHGAPTDSRVWLDKNNEDSHILRGGSWLQNAIIMRAANRGRGPADFRSASINGFRLARTLP